MTSLQSMLAPLHYCLYCALLLLRLHIFWIHKRKKPESISSTCCCYPFLSTSTSISIVVASSYCYYMFILSIASCSSCCYLCHCLLLPINSASHACLLCIISNLYRPSFIFYSYCKSSTAYNYDSDLHHLRYHCCSVNHHATSTDLSAMIYYLYYVLYYNSTLLIC